MNPVTGSLDEVRNHRRVLRGDRLESIAIVEAPGRRRAGHDDVKTAALFDFVGLPALCLEREATAEALTGVLRQAHDDRVAIAGHLRAWKAEMAVAYDDFFLSVDHRLFD